MKNPWHAGRLIYAMAGYFDWSKHLMMTEFDIDGSQADLVFISKAGYATEIEIKVSLADWNADQKKHHWKIDRPHVSRFFYAIPETLENKIPDWIPAHVGIIVVFERPDSPYYRYDGIRIVRDAKRMKALKIPDARIQTMFRNCYYRYWRQNFNTLGHHLAKQQRERKNGSAGNHDR